MVFLVSNQVTVVLIGLLIVSGPECEYPPPIHLLLSLFHTQCCSSHLRNLVVSPKWTAPALCQEFSYKHLGASPIQLHFLCTEILAQTQFSTSLAHLVCAVCCPKVKRVISYILSSFLDVYGRKASQESVTPSYPDVKFLIFYCLTTTETSAGAQ